MRGRHRPSGGARRPPADREVAGHRRDGLRPPASAHGADRETPALRRRRRASSAASRSGRGVAVRGRAEERDQRLPQRPPASSCLCPLIQRQPFAESVGSRRRGTSMRSRGRRPDRRPPRNRSRSRRRGARRGRAGSRQSRRREPTPAGRSTSRPRPLPHLRRRGHVDLVFEGRDRGPRFLVVGRERTAAEEAARRPRGRRWHRRAGARRGTPPGRRRRRRGLRSVACRGLPGSQR